MINILLLLVTVKLHLR